MFCSSKKEIKKEVQQEGIYVAQLLSVTESEFINFLESSH